MLTAMAKTLRGRSWLCVLGAFGLAYVIGYVAVMNRHLPTSPIRAENNYFESSFRWAPKMRAGKEGTGPETQFPEVTFWNVIYTPMDRVYFAVFPRRNADVERLRELGYYQ